MGHISGTVTVFVECADRERLLNRILDAGIRTYDVCYRDGLTFLIRVHRADISKLTALVERAGGRGEIKRRQGVYWKLLLLCKRHVLILGLMLLILFAAWLPGRILFIRVEGNVSVPARKIVEEASSCGLYFGCSRRELRSERIKNGLLENMEQLQWVGVNTKGCVATVSVRERNEQEMQPQTHEVGSILAVRDGIITSCTVTKGNSLCAPGQAVKAGDVLVSGYTDLGLTVQATRAQGEIYAQTNRQIIAVYPDSAVSKGERTGKIQNFSLIIGKKRINLWKDSRILQPGCDKIYVQYYLTLPGGFQLPVAIAVETCYTYGMSVISVSENAAQDGMQQYADAYLKGQMVGGRILSKNVDLNRSGDVFLLHSSYVCEEMIGKEYSEEIIAGYGKDR